MSPKKTFEPVKTGADPRGGSETENRWLTIDPNTSVDVVALVDADNIISCEQCAIWLTEGKSPVWVYSDPEDPSHDLNLDRRYRAYLPVVLVEGGKLTDVLVWSMGKQAHSNLLDISDANGQLAGLEIRIKRTGSGLATRYFITPKGKQHNVSRFDEVDVVDMLGTTDPDEIKEMIADKLGLATYNEVLEKYRGKASKKAAAPAKSERQSSKAKAKVVEEVEDLDDDDEEEEDLDDLELT